MNEITRQSTYLEAFNVSLKMAKYAYKLYLLNTPYEWEDFRQDCAVLFFGSLKEKYSAFDSINITSVAYKWLALNKLKKFYSEIKKYSIEYGDLWYRDYHYDLIKMQIGLSIKEWDIVNKFVEGYQLKEVAQQVGYSINTIQTMLTNIRKKLAKYFRLNDYSKNKRQYKILDGNYKSGKEHPKSKTVIVFNGNNIVGTFESARQAESVYGTGVFASLYKGYKCKGLIFRYAEQTDKK